MYRKSRYARGSAHRIRRRKPCPQSQLTQAQPLPCPSRDWVAPLPRLCLQCSPAHRRRHQTLRLFWQDLRAHRPVQGPSPALSPQREGGRGANFFLRRNTTYRRHLFPDGKALRQGKRHLGRPQVPR